MNPIRVLLADDHALVRAGIAALLGRLPDVAVVAEAGDGLEALALIREHRPDVALVDIAMPGLGGLEVAARAKEECPGVRVLILSMHTSEEYVRRALQAGRPATCSRTPPRPSWSWRCGRWRAARRTSAPRWPGSSSKGTPGTAKKRPTPSRRGSGRS